MKTTTVRTGIAVSLVATATATFPYNPTRVLYADDSNTLYIFTNTLSDSGQFELLSVNINQTVASEHLPYVAISTSLPFAEPGISAAFTPVVDRKGTVLVYAGECDVNQEGSRLWRLDPWMTQSTQDVGWKEEAFTMDVDSVNASVAAARYLATGISFGYDETEENSKAYFFGGMCPSEQTTEEAFLQGDYSNHMLRFAPQSSQSISAEYILGMSEDKGPPIPEAGCSITPLRPTFHDSSDGMLGKQQDFLLLGGHTEKAFINTSQIALFSLPQEGWTFIDVATPSTVRTDLAARGASTEPEPRSGHTAVLSRDGKRLVVFGGWVGDVDTPAEPQLAVLEVGQGFGGDGPWQWHLPPVPHLDLGSGTGLHGHGSAMLPGDIMMVVGGYIIPADAPTLPIDQSFSKQTFFFNLTSNTWVNEYVPPVPESDAEGQSRSGPFSTTSQKIGLGAGLTVGVSALAFLLYFFYWHNRWSKLHRERRDRNIREMALSAHIYHDDSFQRESLQHAGSEPYSELQRKMTDLNASRGWRSGNGGEAERTGLLVEIPSPTRGLRRNSQVKGRYQAGTRYSELRTAKGSGSIHPIDERDEDEDDQTNYIELNPGVRRGDNLLEEDNADATESDPFRDPVPRASHSQGKDPYSLQDRDRYAPSPHQSNLTQSQGADGNKRAMSDSEIGRQSPSKSDRTASDLSDHSMRSNLSYSPSRPSTGNGAPSVIRTSSARSRAHMSGLSNTFGSVIDPSEDHQAAARASSRQSLNERRYSFTPSFQGSINENEHDVPEMVDSSFARLQAEGEALLGGPPHVHHDGSGSTEGTRESESPAGDSPRAVPRLGWMQSVRRVLTRSISGAGNMMPASALARVLGSRTHIPAMAESERTETINETLGFPRRAASEGGLWRGRRGPRDWAEDTGAGDFWRPRSGDDWGSPEDQSRRTTLTGGMTASQDLLGDDYDENEDWDVESAAERRVVQVTFTVPRTRLRIVNADPDGNSITSREERRDGRIGTVQNLASTANTMYAGT